MNTTAIKTSAIIKELSRIPDAGLDKIKMLLDSILVDAKTPPPNSQSLKGIWKDAGFEKIYDLEGELSKARGKYKTQF